MRFIHTADVHLGMKPDKDCAWSAQRAGELWEGFARITACCAKEKIDLLLIAGDLFHRQPGAGELKEAGYLLSKIPDTQVVLIAGNHDYLASEPGRQHSLLELEQYGNVTVLGGNKINAVSFSKWNTVIYGVSCCSRKTEEEIYLKAVPDRLKYPDAFHILMAHGGYGAADPQNFDYIALGHIHKPGFIGKKAAYPGSPEPLDLTETGRHGYIMGEWNHGSRNVWFVPSCAREYRDLTITAQSRDSEQSVRDRIAEEILKGGKNHFYRVRLEGYRDEAVLFHTDLLKKCGNITEVDDITLPDYDFDDLRQQNQGNILGMFIDQVRMLEGEDEWKDKVLYYGVEALLAEGGN